MCTPIGFLHRQDGLAFRGTACILLGLEIVMCVQMQQAVQTFLSVDICSLHRT